MALNDDFTEARRKLKISPTILPDMYFDAETDANIFHKYSNYSRWIENIVANRTSQQLRAVEETYNMLYIKDLKKDFEIKSSESDIWKTVVLERFYERYEYQAYILWSAMTGDSDKVVQILIDAVCTKRLYEINKIKKAYKDMYERDLIKDIQTKTSGHIGRILSSIVITNRHTTVDIKLAQKEAKQLYDARRNEDGTIDAEIFTNIFSAGHSFEQLGKMFLYYKELSGHSIIRAIRNLKSDTLQSACLTIFRYIEDPITYYCEVIWNALIGSTENENNFHRLKNVIVSRCEIDLKSIKERFQKLYGTSLEKECNRFRVLSKLSKKSNWSKKSTWNGLRTLIAYASDRSQIYPSVWQQVKEIMETLESVLPFLEFGISRVIALYAVNWGFQSSFNAEHLTFNDECDRVDGRNLSCDTAVAIANFAVIRDGRPLRIRWKIHDKNDEMWIGFTMNQSYVTSRGGYRNALGIVSYYGGRERYIGLKRYPAIEEPILGEGEKNSGYGSLQIPGAAKHVLQPYSKGHEIELEICLTIKGNGDWISLYHNKKPQLRKWNIDCFTQGIVKLFPFAVIDTPSDDVQFELVM